MIIRTDDIDGRKIFIVDKCLSDEEIKNFYTLVKGLSFTRTEKDHENDQYPIFSVDFIPDKVDGKTAVGLKSRELINRFYPDLDYRLYRSYINMTHYGDMEYPHKDCSDEENDLTIVYYVNEIWDYIWGGETIFYSEKDPRVLVLPKPGRFVLFHGNIEHMGSIPTRECTTSRFSFALKYRLKGAVAQNLTA
ncbi:2OG-Fe(II) oxygenase [Pedobacter sp. GR22-10]|uniref:2OG-Fe(II) oxygenase n=1 Tax=Pedobacter sp. GR22-10 TaxID=2994472 RepID=UPI002245DBA2|nr:2OG-Fe(II) oxygenase [Pedobacter sp. GR22-10]MCX2431628.1 2OG-Fe(II) oxygenase [Pedobacter sp. GR22-10]